MKIEKIYVMGKGNAGVFPRQHCRLSIWMVKTNTEQVITKQRDGCRNPSHPDAEFSTGLNSVKSARKWCFLIDQHSHASEFTFGRASWCFFLHKVSGNHFKAGGCLTVLLKFGETINWISPDCFSYFILMGNLNSCTTTDFLKFGEMLDWICLGLKPYFFLGHTILSSFHHPS